VFTNDIDWSFLMKKLLVLIGAAVFGNALAVDAGVTDTEIRIGASVVLTGPLGPQTNEYGAGSRLLFDAINAKGGINGRKISYTTIDDAFDVARAVENTKKLINDDKIFVLYNSTGTGHTAAVLPILEESKTIAFGPVTGSSVFRDKLNHYLFHVRASYANEAHRIVVQLKQQGITRIAAFYQDDALGNTVLGEIRKAAEQEGVKLATEVKVNPKQPDFKEAAAQTAATLPQAVIMATAGTTFSSFVKAVRETPSRPTFYGFSIASLDVINRELGGDAKGIVLAQIMPSLKNQSIPVVAEYLKLLKEKSAAAQPSASQFEGFVHAKVLVEGLKRGGTKLTTESFISGLESAGEIRYGRFSAKYTPESHNGSNYVELAIIDGNGQLRY
jgi:branched-chain amino acid transport system substrate-binding protein